MNPWTRLIGWLSLGLLIIASFVSVLRYVEKAPFFYLGLETFLVLLFISYKLKGHNFLKAFSFNLAIVVLFLGLAEAYLAWFSPMVTKKEQIENKVDFHADPGTYFIHDEIRGYAAAGNVKKASKKMMEGKIIYEVVYTTNQHGLRVSLHDLAQTKDYLKGENKAAVFFGDSFTFGEGVNDNETLPFMFEEFSEGKYISYNFGFHGYGPHQMLRIIETGLLDKIIPDKKPSVAIYQALINHVERSAGGYPYILWDVEGPKYRLSAAGTPEYIGRFIDNPSHKDKRLYIRILNESYLLNRTGIIHKLFGSERTNEDIELFIGIINQTKKLLKEKYGAELYVVVWPDINDKDSSHVINELKNNQINVITVDKIFMKYKDPPEKYRIEADYHPTRLAHERIARYLLEHIK